MRIMITLTMTITITTTAHHHQLTKRDCATSSEFDNGNNYNNNQQGELTWIADLDIFGDFIRIRILNCTLVATTFETNCILEDDHHQQIIKIILTMAWWISSSEASCHQGQFCSFEKISEMRQNLILNRVPQWATCKPRWVIIYKILTNVIIIVLMLMIIMIRIQSCGTHEAPRANSAKWFRLFFTPASSKAIRQLEQPELFLPPPWIVLLASYDLDCLESCQQFS